MSDALIFEWYQLAEQIAAKKAEMAPLVAREMELRRLVMSTLWPKPEEGVNNYPLSGGYVLKGTHKIDRKVDKAALPAVKEQLRRMSINPDELTRDVPELNIKPYRTLNEVHQHVFDQALIIKPSAPVIELVPPKKVK